MTAKRACLACLSRRKMLHMHRQEFPTSSGCKILGWRHAARNGMKRKTCQRPSRKFRPAFGATAVAGHAPCCHTSAAACWKIAGVCADAGASKAMQTSRKRKYTTTSSRSSSPFLQWRPLWLHCFPHLKQRRASTTSAATYVRRLTK